MSVSSVVCPPSLLPLDSPPGRALGIGGSSPGVGAPFRPASPGVGTPTQPTMVWPPTPSPVASSYRPGDFGGASGADWPVASLGAAHAAIQMLPAPVQQQAPAFPEAWFGPHGGAHFMPVESQAQASLAQLPVEQMLWMQGTPVMAPEQGPPSWTPMVDMGAQPMMGTGGLTDVAFAARAASAPDAGVGHLAVGSLAQQPPNPPPPTRAAASEAPEPHGPEELDEDKLPSMGSAQHGAGKCSPCAWFWKPRGCASGPACDYCHLCPEGELKSRRKAKVELIRRGMLEPREVPSEPKANLESNVGSRASRLGSRRGRRV